MKQTETMVRMGEFTASKSPGEVLLAMGLGSCIGLALVDQARGIAGLAHVVLPESVPGTTSDAAGKFADLAVPALIASVCAIGARRIALRAVLVGGAKMFSAGRTEASFMDVGSRNDAAVRAALGRAGVSIMATATSGNRGRTMRVHLAGCTVVYKEAGGQEMELLAPRRAVVA